MKKQKISKKKESKKEDMSKWPIPAFLFIGIGIGLLTGEVAAFTVIGLGVGIIITYLFFKKKK